MPEKFSIVTAAEKAGLSEVEFIDELLNTVVALMTLQEKPEAKLTHVAENPNGDELTLELTLTTRPSANR